MRQGIDNVIGDVNKAFKRVELVPVEVEIKKGLKSSYVDGSEKLMSAQYRVGISSRVADSFYSETEDDQRPEGRIEWLVSKIPENEVGYIPPTDIDELNILSLSQKHPFSLNVKQKLFDEFYKNRTDGKMDQNLFFLYKIVLDV